MGDDEDSAHDMVNRAGSDSSGLDGAFASRVEPDEHARLALELLVTYEVPLGVMVSADGLSHTVIEPQLPRVLPDGSWSEPIENERFTDERYNLLDHRIAARFQSGPYALVGVPDSDLDSSVDPDAPIPTPLPGTDVQGHETMNFAAFEVFGADPLPVDESPLRTVYGISEEDIDRALSLASNILLTLDAEYRLRDQVILDDGRRLAAVRLLSVRQRAPHRLAAALQNLHPAPGSELTGIAPDPLFLTQAEPAETGPGAVGNHYSFDGAQAARMGGAVALHALRVNLRRMTRSERAETYGLDVSALDDAISMIEGYVGHRFFETSRYADSSCFCHDLLCPGLPSNSAGYLDCELYFRLGNDSFARDPLSPDIAHWTAYFPPGDPTLSAPDGNAVLVRTRDEAFCLQYGHFPDGTGEGCIASPTSLLSFDQLSPAGLTTGAGRPGVEALGLEAKRFVIPNLDTYAEPHPARTGDATAYIFWMRGSGDDRSFELLDVVQPKLPGSTHVFGGRFGELFSEIVAKSPMNPGLPAVTSLGLATDLVPPLENELTSDGDAFEDSFQVYLDNAAISARSAGQLLAEAREFELQALLNDRADAALLEEAALAENEVISAACGDLPDCELPRLAEVALGDLDVGGEPFVTPLPPTEVEFLHAVVGEEPWIQLEPSDALPPSVGIVSCSEHMANFTTAFSFEGIGKRGWGRYMESYLASGLGCTRYFLRNAATEALLHDVPVAVIEELATGGPGEFPQYSGEVREPLIRLYQNLLNLRQALRGFEATYRVALSELGQARLQLDEAIPSKKRAALCKLGRAMAVIGTVVASVAAAVVTLGAGLAVVIATVVVAVAATAGSITGLIGADSCMGEAEPAAQLIEQTFAGAVMALSNLQGVADDVRRLAGQVALADSQMDRLQRRAQLAEQRRVVTEHIIDSNALADIPEWRALQSFRVRRARDSLRRAQRYAFVARRAVEFRLVEDLPYITRPETFTEAPTIWANDLFTVDTASSADGDPGDTSIDHVNTSGEAIEDYVEKLGDFVRGYPFSRRFRDGTDNQVLSLRNMARDVMTDGTSPSFYSRLVYKCRDLEASTLVADGEIPCATSGGVEYAEARFSIPAIFDEYLADRLAVGNFNYRHERTALNMVGAAFVDCRYAVRPIECYGDGNVRYSMRQDGRVMLDAFDFEKRLYEMEPGVMQGARALAAERVLTNPLSSTDRSLISPFERTELWGRPLRGVYTIRIEGRPEIVWRNLDDIQLMLQYRYWTRQE